MWFAFTGPHLVMPTLPSTHPEYYQPSSSPFPIPILKTIINAKVLLSANVVPLIHLIENFHKEVCMLQKVFSKPFLAQSSGCLPWLHGKNHPEKVKKTDERDPGYNDQVAIFTCQKLPWGSVAAGS